MTFLLIIHFYSILTFVCHCNLCSCRWKCSFKSHNIVVDGIVKYSIEFRTLAHTRNRRIANTESYKLAGLYPDTLYYVWLAARSQRGEGATTPPIPVRTKQYGKLSYYIFWHSTKRFFLWARKFLVLGFFGCHKTWPIFVLIFDVEKNDEDFFWKKDIFERKKNVKWRIEIDAFDQQFDTFCELIFAGTWIFFFEIEKKN